MEKFRKNIIYCMLATVLWVAGNQKVLAQQLSVYDFVIYSNGGVQAGTSTIVNSGNVGSNSWVTSTGNATFNGDIISKGYISLANSNIVGGNIVAANQGTTAAATSLQTGSNATLKGTANVNGNVVIGGGTVNGPVVYTGTYSGPAPVNGATKGTPTIPTFPLLPGIISSPAPTSQTITSSQVLTPGSYGDMALGGSKTVTFSGPGIYVFNSIKNSGNTNTFSFDFQNSSTGTFIILVAGDVDLYKVNIVYSNLVLPNGTAGTAQDVAARIFMQVKGTGSTSPSGKDAWIMANGASGNNQSVWYGTVWAPNGNINVGSGSNPSKIIGALYTGSSVILQNGVGLSYAKYLGCSFTVNAGPDQQLTCSNPTTVLNGSSSSPTAQFSWSKIGGTLSGTTTAATLNVSSVGSYILTASNPGCSNTVSDTAVVTSVSCVLPYYPPPPTGKVTNKLGAELTSLEFNYGNVLDDGKTMFLTNNGNVLIDVIVYSGNYSQVAQLLMSSQYGMTDTIPNGPNSLTITGWFPIANLGLFNVDPLYSLINFVRPAYPPVTNSGIVMTQGDSSIRTYVLRNGYHLSGDSVKVGVLSDSYNTLPNTDVQTEDLPGNPADSVNPHPVEVLKDYPYGARSDEGRAMLQIVHDVAPKSKLAFRTGFISPGDMAQGILDLARDTCNVIVDDVSFVTEPFFRPGQVANAITYASSRGIHYITAAGNFGVKSYEGIFTPSSTPPPAGITGVAHDFGGGDIFQSDSVKGTSVQPGIYTLVLQWDDNFYSLGSNSGTVYDFDAYALDNLGNTIGFNRVNIAGDPIEVLTFVVTQNTTINVMIVNATGTAATTPVRFKYVVFRGDLKINEHILGNSTIVGHANAPEAVTVGASLYSNTPAYHVNNITPSSFSSVGGTYYNGSPSAKPDLMGPSGVNTTVNFGSVDVEGDGIPNFFGTSASAPHVAGTIALMVEARKKYYNQILSPVQMKQLLETTAIDMGTAGFDYNSGYGFVNADSAIRTQANPIPQISGLQLTDTTKQIGVVPVNVVISGNYLSPTTKIILGSDTLPISYVNSTQITTTIPEFYGNQVLYAYNTPKSPLLTDGGLSNAWPLTGIIKKNVVVTANNAQRKYGQTNPAFSSTILVNGQPTTLTLSDLGLQSMTYSTPATSSSFVGIYYIRPVRIFDSTGTDSNYLKFYNYSFVDGALTVQKMPLTITPLDRTISYGDAMGSINYNFSYDQTNVPNPSQFTDSIGYFYRSYTPDNALAVLNGFTSPMPDGSYLSVSDLQNLNILASFQALKNSRSFSIANNKLIPAATDSFNRFYVIDLSAQSLYNYKTTPALATFINGYPGYSNKAMVSLNALSNGAAQANYNGATQALINGSLAQTLAGSMGYMAPIVSGQLIQLVNGQLVQLVNGQPVPVSNTQLVQLVNSQLVQLVNGVFVPIANSQLVQLVNGALVEMTNGQLVQLVNGVQTPIVNGQLVQLVNGQLVQLVNGQQVPIQNGQLVQLVNSQLVQMVNGALTAIPNGSLTQLVNSQLVQLVNGQLVQLVNSTGVGGFNGNTGVIVDQNDVSVQGGWLGAMVGMNMITGLSVGTQYLVPGVFINPNFDVSYGTGKITIQPAPVTIRIKDSSKVYGQVLQLDPRRFSITSGQLVNGDSIDSISTNCTGLISSAAAGTYPITPKTTYGSATTNLSNYAITYQNGTLTVLPASLKVTADNKTRLYGTPNPTFTATFSGFQNGETFTTSGITGSPAFSTSAVLTSLAGNYDINISKGTLASTNYSLDSFFKGTLTIQPNPCLVTHSTFSSFASTTKKATSLWFNIETKISGQLTVAGDYLLFNAGTLTLNNISSTPLVNRLPLPSGKIIADASVTAPVTSFDLTNNMWVTKVPLGFSSTSDVFITGAIVNSSNGFVNAKNGNSVVDGIFTSNKVFSDQWSYAMAAYQPQFAYTSIAQPNQVASINGSYRAGTPIPEINYLVAGGTGNGGNNYTGSSSSMDSYTTCASGGTVSSGLNNGLLANNPTEPTIDNSRQIHVYPNPNNGKFTVIYTFRHSGSSHLSLAGLSGNPVLESDNGPVEGGRSYRKEISLSGLAAGTYFVRIDNGSEILIEKIIVFK